MFGVIGDPHIVSKEHVSTQWLREKVFKLNKLDLDFVLVCGDTSHRGRLDELQLAKEILDGLHAEYYCCHGNHDYVFDGGVGLTLFRDVFGSTQFVVQIHNYNILVLQMTKREETPLKINTKLPSIALIHTTSRTSQNLLFPYFDNPKLENLLKSYNVIAVFQGHIHSEQKTAHHKGIQYFNCSAGLGLGYLGSSVFYMPVTDTVEEALSKLVSMRDRDND